MCYMYFRSLIGLSGYNLASHGRPNRFILTERDRERGGGVGEGGEVHVLETSIHPSSL